LYTEILDKVQDLENILGKRRLDSLESENEIAVGKKLKST